MSGSRELCTHDGARMLARELNWWWHSRGHLSVQHWIEPIHYSKLAKRGDRVPTKSKDEGIVWVVKSNLIRGLPP